MIGPPTGFTVTGSLCPCTARCRSVDARDPGSARFGRVVDARAAHQRYRALGGPATHQDGDMPWAAGHAETPISKTVCPELVEGPSLSFDAAEEEQSFDKLRANGRRKDNVISLSPRAESPIAARCRSSPSPGGGLQIGRA